jgi:serine/threonine/tyrosine-interacting protein
MSSKPDPWSSLHQITPLIFLGDIDSSNLHYIQPNDIRCVIAFHVEISAYRRKQLSSSRVAFYHLPLPDENDANIIGLARRAHRIACQFISRGKKVLFQCAGGISRSSSALIYHRIHKGQSFDEALQLLESKRPHVCPNRGFEAQLRQEEKDYRDKLRKRALHRLNTTESRLATGQSPTTAPTQSPDDLHDSSGISVTED